MATDRKLALRTLSLVEEILRDPFQGTGKPETLKYLAPNTLLRRLTQEHRTVYLVQGWPNCIFTSEVPLFVVEIKANLAQDRCYIRFQGKIDSHQVPQILNHAKGRQYQNQFRACA